MGVSAESPTPCAPTEVVPSNYRVRRDPDWSNRWAAFDHHGDCVAHVVGGSVSSLKVPRGVLTALMQAAITNCDPVHEDDQ